MLIRLVHNQTTEGPILLSTLEDGLPNKEFGIYQKQQVYLPYYHTFFNDEGMVEVDRSRAGFLDLAPTEAVQNSRAKGAIAALTNAGIFDVLEIPTGALKKHKTTRLYQSVKATEDGAIIIKGSNFVSYNPDVTSITLVDSLGGNEITLDENDARVTVTASSITITGFGDGDETYMGGKATITANGKTVIAAIDLPFVTEWATTTIDETITLPLIESGTYDMVVDWGDGTTDEITAHNAIEATHTYAVAGTYEVAIKGVVDHWNFNDVAASKDKVTDIKQWGSLRLGEAAPFAFLSCTNLDVTAHDTPNLIKATSLQGTFAACSVLIGTSVFGDWDVSGITNMQQSFNSASVFNQNIGGWDTSSVTTMFAMFASASSFDQNIGSWDITALEEAGSMFAGSAGLSVTNYDALLNGWASQNVQPDVDLGATNIQYSNTGKPGRDALTGAPNNWTITDGGNVDA